MHYGSEKCVSGLWLVAAALKQRPRTVKSSVRYSSTAWCTVAKFENMSFLKCATTHYMMQARLEGTDDSA